jgi:hypothetical protein
MLDDVWLGAAAGAGTRASAAAVTWGGPDEPAPAALADGVVVGPTGPWQPNAQNENAIATRVAESESLDMGDHSSGLGRLQNYYFD